MSEGKRDLSQAQLEEEIALYFNAGRNISQNQFSSKEINMEKYDYCEPWREQKSNFTVFHNSVYLPMEKFTFYDLHFQFVFYELN